MDLKARSRFEMKWIWMSRLEAAPRIRRSQRALADKEPEDMAVYKGHGRIWCPSLKLKKVSLGHQCLNAARVFPFVFWLVESQMLFHNLYCTSATPSFCGL